ncbi:MAG: hypothetical protein HKN33_17870 [Pyrinomonadaceae bacterium]|nr:hypothetical protein [Pyrinomonadaceae bacterium]
MRFRKAQTIAFILLLAVGQAFAQDDSAEKTGDATATPSPTPELTGTQLEGTRVAEASVLVYSQFTGRVRMNQIRKTTVEYGTIELTDAEGKKTKATYEKRMLRGDSLDKTKIRIDQSFPDARYSLVYDGEKIFGVFGTTVFDPRADAKASFSHSIWHGLDALLRYYENGSKINFEKDEKIMGVDYRIITSLDKQGRKTTFYISKKSYRVMMLEYEEAGVKYRRKFYDYNYAQNTLVPYRTVLWANGKRVEEKRTSTVTFGQEVGEEYFDFS